MVLGLKVTVVPTGAPVADKLTALLKPSEIVVRIVPIAFPPGVALMLPGVVNVNAGGSAEVTVRKVVSVCVTPPPLAVTVTG